ncbi:MAG: DNA gyrase subunit A [Elusimicrobiaceae bacterium]|nr:DNA gyrase subunit A [Elusimicrobiaceae bacterium]
MTDNTNNQTNSTELFDQIHQRDIGEEMRNSYIDYAMSVIIGRALPDARDGLKPVHRRILYAMQEMGLKYNKPFKKSARVVGDVLGKYHPHGDSSVYDALVRMAQNFSIRNTLVNGQGNFGSIDGDSPAAMRYTEVRLNHIADELLEDLDKDTVKFVPNYDGSLMEPAVLPAKMPQLLVNGSNGIAVGMATNIPTHNLAEICDGIIALIKNPAISTKEMMQIVKGPDFPTGGILRGTKGVYDYFESGRGSLKIQARAEIEEMKGGREAIIVTEIPYQVNKTVLIETIAGLVKDKKITEISDIRDESDRRGMRLVIELKREATGQVVLNQLFKHTQLQTSFGVNMLAIVDGKPRVLSMKEAMRQYIRHRQEVITNRTRFDLNKALKRSHILDGLLLAIANLDEVVAIIRKSKDAQEARVNLMARFKFTEPQAQAILDMRLHQLTQLSSIAIEQEQKDLKALIKELQDILGNPRRILDIIVDELTKMKKDYGDERRTEISTDVTDFSVEDFIEEEEVVITLSHSGYAKRIPLDTYRSQNRGGKGIIGVNTKEEDFIEHLFVTSSHATILMFTNRGRVFALKAYEIPEGNRQGKGKAIVNMLQITGEEKVTSAVAFKDFDPKNSGETYLTMCTRFGTMKRVALENFANIRRSGIIAIGLDEGDVLVSVQETHGKSDIIVATRNGKSIRFDENQVRAMGRTAYGVRAIRMAEGDVVIGMEQGQREGEQPDVLSVCENGYGKRTEFSEYRTQRRGGMGVITIKTSERNGKVVGIKLVDESKDLMVITEKGMAIRIRCEEIRSVGRNAQGVRLVKLEEGDKIAKVTPVVKEEEEKAKENMPLEEVKESK